MFHRLAARTGVIQLHFHGDVQSRHEQHANRRGQKDFQERKALSGASTLWQLMDFSGGDPHS
jgi:hypothetical protein